MERRKVQQMFFIPWDLLFNVDCKSFLIICLVMYENLHEACIYLEHQILTSMELSVSEKKFHKAQVSFSGFRNCNFDKEDTR